MISFLKSTEKRLIINMLGTYHDSEDLINIGAYKKGSNKEVDEAIKKYPHIMAFLKQGLNETDGFEKNVSRMIQAFGKGGQ